jgi:hypothetical protein
MNLMEKNGQPLKKLLDRYDEVLSGYQPGKMVER